ncbi:MAG TPA: CBASS cGAMP-activated phospholipase [Nitrososphaera sp.]|nr:CBASS cGAMP-activated phospholipase [Nitrososphaera sp.]
MANVETTNCFQILSLDGGGIKGLFSAAVLASIEEDLRVNVVDHFDLIAGTSTGGIIALALGLGMTPKQIVEFYVSRGPVIFPTSFGIRRLQHWFHRKYPPEPLMNSLKECFGDKLFGQSSKRLVITSFNVGEDDVYLFRTPHHERLNRDYKFPAWKVAMATSAAPTFFPTSRHVDGIRLMDGGIWANNPTMVGIIEAFGTLNVPLNTISVFSIGTSESVVRRPKRLDGGGIISWARDAAVVEIIMRGQSIAAFNQASLLLGKERIERLSPKVAADEFSLDGVHRADDLIAKAAHHSRSFMPIFKAKFMPHQAVPYKPIYL